MRKRHLIIAALLVGFAGVAFAVVKDEFFFEPGVTARNFERLRQGMSKAEVEAVLGTNGEPSGVSFMCNNCRFEPKVWAGVNCQIQLTFADGGPYSKGPCTLLCGGICQIEGGPRQDLAPMPEEFLAQLRRWVGW